MKPLSFCIYGIMPLLITFAFGDSYFNNRSYLAFSVIFMLAGAFAYIRSRLTVLQMSALLGGMSLSFVCALLDPAYLISELDFWISSPRSWMAEIG